MKRAVAFVLMLCMAAPAMRAEASIAFSPISQLIITNRIFLDRFDDVARAGGRSLAADIASRMANDGNQIVSPTPANYAPADWQERLGNIVRLDTELVNGLLGQKQEPLATLTGLHERLVRVTADGTLQPYAIYIPKSFRTAANPSIVVLLHGQPQTESELMSSPYFRKIADAHGSIVVAPWGRGNYDYAPPADEEVYTALDDVVKAFPVDPKHVYLAGYSMGGFSVFKVAPLHAMRWAGVLCIAGAILPPDATLVGFRMRDTPFYVVTGQNDQTIPAKYGELTVAFLQSTDIPVNFYEEPDGQHWLSSLERPIAIAWSDMLSGVAHTTDAKFARSAAGAPKISQPSTGVMKP